MIPVNEQPARQVAASNTAAAKASPWLLCFAPRPAAALRLFCFSHAGTGGAMYRAWLAALPSNVELCAVQLPGRENRWREPALKSINDLVEAVLPALLPALDRPFAFFGHSMGALLAYELTRALQSGHHPLPVCLSVSGHRAPDIPDPEAPMHRLSDDEFIAEIGRRYGGIPAEVLRERDLLELLLPGLRADITAIETHTFVPGPLLNCPITVLGGDADHRAPAHQLAAWRNHTQARMRMRTFPGGHFYLSDADVRAALIAELLLDLVDGAGR